MTVHTTADKYMYQLNNMEDRQTFNIALKNTDFLLQNASSVSSFPPQIKYPNYKQHQTLILATFLAISQHSPHVGMIQSTQCTRNVNILGRQTLLARHVVKLWQKWKMTEIHLIQMDERVQVIRIDIDAAMHGVNTHSALICSLQEHTTK